MKVQCSINQQSLYAIIDTAADVSVISENVFQTLNPTPVIVQEVNLRAAAEGQIFKARITEPVEIQIGDVRTTGSLHVASIQDDMLLGIDFLHTMQATINLQSGSMQLGSSEVPLIQTHKPAAIDVRTHRKIRCPPWSSVEVGMQVPQMFQNCSTTLDPNISLPVFISAAVYGENQEMPVVLSNMSDNPVCLPSGTLMGRLFELHPDEIPIASVSRLEMVENRNIEEVVLPEKLWPLWEDTKNTVSNTLNPEEVLSIKHLLHEYSDVFADNDLDLGDFDEISHVIDTGDSQPVKCGLRRTPIHFVEEEDGLLQKMLGAGVIRPSFSSWSAAPVFVRKRDGQTRWCLDYRKLNACTKKDVYPVPMMSECLDALDGNAWFSKLDANSAYWQIPVEEQSKEKTAFRTRQGLFEFNKLPFGLCNAPSTYCRAMSIVLAGLNWSKVLAFVDDICVLGTSIGDHLQNLRAVFERFRHYKLRLKPKKCSLFQNEVEFLGRKINTEGMTLTDHSINTIENWSPPTSCKEVEQFLGLANFHRMFIPDFSKISEPLSRLLKKKSFHWDEPQQQAFIALKEKLLSPPVLAVPSRKGEFILDTDASDVAIGAQLNQKQNGVERVIAFASFSLTSCQRKYCTTRKELLAVVRFTNHFRHYLLGDQFTVRTDHHSLLWLLNFKKLEGQLARWHEELSRFNMLVQHRPGKHHQNADALSRIPEKYNCQNYDAQTPLHLLPCKGCKYCQRAYLNWKEFELAVDDVVELVSRKDPPAGSIRMVDVSPGLTEQAIIALQKEDPKLKFLNEWLVNGVHPGDEFLKLGCRAVKHYWINRDMLLLKNNVLYWRGVHQNLLVVPESVKLKVLHLCHDLPSSGHQGVEGTKNRVKQRYYWYGLTSDVKKYVMECGACNVNKHTNRKNRCPLTIYQAGYPLEKIHIDFMGPLPRTADGNEHLLVIVDNFSKWCEFVPLPSQEAEVTAWAVVKEFLLRFGCPLEIMSDQGRNFESTLFKEMCELFKIHKLRTTAYRPSANGQAERMNRTLLQSLRCFINKKQNDWDKWVPFVASSIRSSVNRQTGFTPNKLMLGREVTMPAELVIPGEARGQVSHSQFIQDIQDGLQEAHAQARMTLKVRTKQMKRDYDLRAHLLAFQKGEAVYILDKSIQKGLSPKLRSIWSGPCLVTEVLTPYLYRIQINNRSTKVVNHDRLKKCWDKNLPPWLLKRQTEIVSGLVPTFCFCGLPDDGQLMIQCDSCLEWFHGHCVGMKRTQAREVKEFFCLRCLE